MEQHKHEYKIRNMCKALQVNKSGYYAYLKRSSSPYKTHIKKVMQRIFDKHKQRIGSPKMYAHLIEENICISKKTVGRYMKNMGLVAKNRSPKRKKTGGAHVNIANTLNRAFTAELPNQKWVSDITYLPTRSGWLYLCIVLDLYSRKIVSYDVALEMDTSLVLRSLNKAIYSRNIGLNHDLIFHSDQGSQYTSAMIQAFLAQHGIKQSMSRRGNCWDNACAESFFKSLKSELLEKESWSVETMKQALFEYIEVYYNQQRKHSAIGYCSPNQFEMRIH
jgi:transposase InsO family protein